MHSCCSSLIFNCFCFSFNLVYLYFFFLLFLNCFFLLLQILYLFWCFYNQCLFFLFLHLRLVIILTFCVFLLKYLSKRLTIFFTLVNARWFNNFSYFSCLCLQSHSSDSLNIYFLFSFILTNLIYYILFLYNTLFFLWLFAEIRI